MGTPNAFDHSGTLTSEQIDERLSASLDPKYELALIFYKPPFEKVPEELPKANVVGDVELSDGTTISAINSVGAGQKQIEKMLEFLQIDPESAKVHNSLGLVHLVLGSMLDKKRHYEQARYCFEQAFIHDRIGCEYYNNISMAHYRLGNLEEAFFFQERSLELNPCSFGGKFNMGFLYFAIGKDETAEKFLDEAAKLDTRSALPHYYRAVISAKRKNWAAAYEEVTKCIELDPKNPHYYYHRALGSESAGNYQSAIDDLQKAINLNPKEPEFHVRLSGNYWYLKDFGNAKKSLKTALELIEAIPIRERTQENYDAAILATNGLKDMGVKVEKDYRKEARERGFLLES